MMTKLLVICHTHDLSWDMDMDPPQCSCLSEDLDLLVIEEQELPFYEDTE